MIVYMKFAIPLNAIFLTNDGDMPFYMWVRLYKNIKSSFVEKI